MPEELALENKVAKRIMLGVSQPRCLVWRVGIDLFFKAVEFDSPSARGRLMPLQVTRSETSRKTANLEMSLL